MKLITAIIKPFKTEEVRDALSSIGVTGLTVTQAKGCGHQKGRSGMNGGTQYGVDYLPKARLEAAVPDDLLDLAVEAIEKSARTGKMGDGKIFVSDLQEVVRIRTGETGYGRSGGKPS